MNRLLPGRDRKAQGAGFPMKAQVLSTVVSGYLMKEIARSYDAEAVETLTGFQANGPEAARLRHPGDNVDLGTGKVIARPSGTEPKIKFHILLKEPADDLSSSIVAY